MTTDELYSKIWDWIRFLEEKNKGKHQKEMVKN